MVISVVIAAMPSSKLLLNNPAISISFSFLLNKMFDKNDFY